MIKEKINVEQLFEKYRPLMDLPEMRKKYSGWCNESSIEEYMIDEGYGQGVVLFFTYIDVITNEKYKTYSTKSRRYPSDIKYDTGYDEIIIERNDNKFFKLELLCVEDGDYSEDENSKK